MHWLRFVIVALFLSLTMNLAAAQPIGAGPHVHITLVAESDRPAPGGEVMLAFSAVPEKGWHAYWLNPGDAGLPAKTDWTLPQGVTAGAIRYPVPHRLMIAGLANYVYEGPYALLATLKIPAQAQGSLPVKVLFDYLVCSDQMCVPEKAELSIALQTGDGAVSAERRAEFDRWRAALPRQLDAQATYQVTGKDFRMAVPFPASAAIDGDAYFFPATEGGIEYAAPQTVTRDGDRLVIATKAGSASGPIEGVLAIGGKGFEVRATPGTVAAAASAAPAEAQAGWGAALLAFFGAVLGGVILNIMPCVFPILSLKALSLAKANVEGGNPRGEALAYTAGVVLVCLALGGVMLALRAGGATVGWAFQLQNPQVILLLLLLVMGIALNLAGLFEMAAPAFVNRASARGSGGAFMTGALAAFVATPCAGPFMGAAIGAALVLPWPAALAVFAGLGLGIALPFLLLGFVPALRRLLPRPGAWMETLRRILSVPMFLTAVALAWVLGKQAGVAGMTQGLAAALLAGLGLWWTGLRQRKGKAGAWVPGLLLLLAGAAAIVWVRPAPAVAQVESGEKFSEARLAELTAQGRPVFVYFTADWCLTCKVNEKAAIETEAVEKAFADNKVAVLVGDWTDGDPVLGRFIEAHNRAGVPLYLWYKPGEAEPQVLPQVLTQGMLTGLASGK
jgi:thiol:disulfide interchange protein